MADDNTKNYNIEDDLPPEMSSEDKDLFFQYTSEKTSLQEKTDKFHVISDLIKKLYEMCDTTNSDCIKIMYEIMASTPEQILSYVDTDINKDLFSFSVEALKSYIAKGLKSLNHEIYHGVKGRWMNFEQTNRKKIGLSIWMVCEDINNNVLNFHRTHPPGLVMYEHDIVKKINKAFIGKVYEAEELLNAVYLDDSTIRKEITNLYRIARNQFNKASHHKEEMKSLLDETRQFVLKNTFKAEAQKFNKTANNHMWRAWASLGLAFLLGGLAILWGVNFSSPTSASTCETESFLQSFLCTFWGLDTRSFLFVAGIWGAGIFASLRSYFANMQNEVNNRHRFNALQSYEILYNAVTTLEDKNFIMTKAVECAYSHQPTGFVKQQPIGFVKQPKELKES